jgi:hypothetical protein
MFAKSEGPTALRAELVRALAFSDAKIERPGESPVESVAALAAVWNGRKGYVALLVRDVEPPRIERYVTENAITSTEALAEATEEGIAFAESLGFVLDAPEFSDLTEAERESRMYRWNKIRKLRKAQPPEVSGGDTGELVLPEPPIAPMPAGLDIGPDELSVPAPPPVPELEISAADVLEAPADPEADTSLLPQGSAVLGKISLVRKGSADARRLEQLARLIAFF